MLDILASIHYLFIYLRCIEYIQYTEYHPRWSEYTSDQDMVLTFVEIHTPVDNTHTIKQGHLWGGKGWGIDGAGWLGMDSGQDPLNWALRDGEEPARQRAWKDAQNSNERENKCEACVPATVLACLGRTKAVTVAEQSDRSEHVIKEVQWVGRDLLAGQGKTFAFLWMQWEG